MNFPYRQNSEKINDWIFQKIQKTLIWAHFPNFKEKKYSKKISLRHAQ